MVGEMKFVDSRYGHSPLLSVSLIIEPTEIFLNDMCLLLPWQNT